MKQDVIVLNCGSSSIKFAIINAQSGESQFSGLAENLGNDDARIKVKQNGASHTYNLPSGALHQE
ncbi:MAG: acetate kinase, partial [Cohaesibacter sp.]|nr:acetate kinase [Cohaesibacter sp.]